jgi:hypothetical protein
MKLPHFSSNITIPELKTSATLLGFILPSPCCTFLSTLHRYFDNASDIPSPPAQNFLQLQEEGLDSNYGGYKNRAMVSAIIRWNWFYDHFGSYPMRTLHRERWERRAFLEGLRKYGQGKWKKISKLIPTR